MRPWLSHSDFGSITTSDILKAEDYSLGTVFRKFFYRPVNDPSFGSLWSVLASGNPWHSQLHPSKPSSSYKQHHWYNYETELSEILFPNGSDHAIIACYFEFYDEGEVEHINDPIHPSQQQRFSFKRLWCDHAVEYLQGSFYTYTCCFSCALHVYRSPSCRYLESGQTYTIYPCK